MGLLVDRLHLPVKGVGCEICNAVLTINLGHGQSQRADSGTILRDHGTTIVSLIPVLVTAVVNIILRRRVLVALLTGPAFSSDL